MEIWAQGCHSFTFKKKREARNPVFIVKCYDGKHHHHHQTCLWVLSLQPLGRVLGGKIRDVCWVSKLVTGVENGPGRARVEAAAEDSRGLQ